jgi:hypothetical protein
MRLPKLFGRDAELAKTKYAGRESASARAARKEADASARRRGRHRNGGAQRAARAGQDWSDREFDRLR